MENLVFDVTRSLLEAGEEYHSEVEAVRLLERGRRALEASAPASRMRRKAGDTLRERDPW